MNPIRTKRPFQRNALAAALAGALILAACGGGGDSGDGDDPGTPGTPGTSVTITGVAAAGLPLVGTVTVKDAQGATRQATIGTNGSYSIDVSGMTAPFVFRAEGRAGGREYVIHSAATAADVGGVINVTPLTDLVLSNIAGEVAANYFARNPDATLTAEALAAETGKLRERLLPILQALGVDAGIDLLRTPFTPLASALDKAIDVLRVSYAANGVATITNVVTQQQIQDDLATRAAQETAAPVMDQTGGVADAGSDIDQIRAALASLSALFATGMPAAGVVEAQLSSGFLFRDMTASEFAADLSSFSELQGATFTDLTIDAIDYSGPTPRATVSFVIKGAQGNLIAPHEDYWQLVKQNGVWRLHGDQRVLDIESVAFMHHTTHRHANGSESSCKESGLSLIVEDYNPGNNAGTIAYVIVTGPGIAQGGARLNAPALGGFFPIDPATSNGGSGNYHVTASECGNFEAAGLASVPDNALYTFKVYDAAGTLLHSYADRVAKRPLTRTELAASTEFPSIATPTFEAFSSYGGGDISLSASGFDALGLAHFSVRLGYTNGDSNDASVELQVPASRAVSTSLAVPGAPAGASIGYRQLEIENLAPSGREFSRRYVISN
jgi:hypothetical protein